MFLFENQALEKAQQQCKGLMQPSKAHKEQLAKLFPSTSAPVTSSRTFDPIARSVVDLQKKKKKKGITRERPRKLTAVLLPRLVCTVPKSSARKKLLDSGRIKKIELRRSMSSLQAKNEILKAFSQFELSQLTVFSCDKSNHVEAIRNKLPNGDELINVAGQGSLYLCEVSTFLLCEVWLLAHNVVGTDVVLQWAWMCTVISM